MIFRKIKTDPLRIERKNGKKFKIVEDETTNRPLSGDEEITIKVKDLGEDILIVSDRPHGNIKDKSSFRVRHYYYRPVCDSED